MVFAITAASPMVFSCGRRIKSVAHLARLTQVTVCENVLVFECLSKSSWLMHVEAALISGKRRITDGTTGLGSVCVLWPLHGVPALTPDTRLVLGPTSITMR